MEMDSTEFWVCKMVLGPSSMHGLMSRWKDCFIWTAAGLYNDYDYWCCVLYCVCLCVCIRNGDLKLSCGRNCDYCKCIGNGVGTGIVSTTGMGWGWEQKLSPCSSLVCIRPMKTYITLFFVVYPIVITAKLLVHNWAFWRNRISVSFNLCRCRDFHKDKSK